MASDSSQVGALWRAEAEGSSGMELKSSVSVHSSRWRFEVRSRRRGNVSSQTHTQTHHIHALYGILPTQPPPHLHVCSSYDQHSHSLSQCFLSSCEWLTRAWGRRETAMTGRGREGEEAGHTKGVTNGCVCYTRLWLSTPSAPVPLLCSRIFFCGYLHCLSSGGCHTSVWLIAHSFSFTWQLAAELFHYFESMVEWDRYKVSPTLLCGHDFWTALAKFSGTNVRELHGWHADNHCVKHIHIHSVVWMGLKLVWLDRYRK